MTSPTERKLASKAHEPLYWEAIKHAGRLFVAAARATGRDSEEAYEDFVSEVAAKVEDGGPADASLLDKEMEKWDVPQEADNPETPPADDKGHIWIEYPGEPAAGLRSMSCEIKDFPFEPADAQDRSEIRELLRAAFSEIAGGAEVHVWYPDELPR